MFDIASAGTSVESTVLNHYVESKGYVRINWTIENLNETDKIRFYLLDCDVSDAGIKCESMKLENRVKEIEISDSYGETEIDIGEVYGIKRLCVNMLHGGQDCDKDNYVLVQEVVEKTNTIERIVEKEVIIDRVEYVVPEPSFIVEIVKFPQKFEAGKNITTIVNVTNPTNFTQQAKVYSYIFSKSKSYTGAWDSNAINIEVAPFSSISIPLENSISKFAKGNMTFRIRAKVNNTNYDVSSSIFVHENLFTKLYANSEVINGSILRVIINNSGNIPANVTVKLYGGQNAYLNVTVFPNSPSAMDYNAENFTFIQISEGRDLVFSSQIKKSPRISGFASYISSQNVLYSVISLCPIAVLYAVTRKYA
jgi:hypothetical protein